MQRAKLHGDLTPHQLRVLELAHLGHKDAVIASKLKVSVTTILYHWREMGTHIPGDWPVRYRAILWYRGAPEHLLYRKPTLPLEIPAPAPAKPSLKALLERHRA